MSVALGFDYGSHKIGVAVGQRVTATATPLLTLSQVRNKPDWDRINRLIREWHPTELVVGLPQETADGQGHMAEAARRFARQLHGRYQLPVHLVNEHLTSREAWSQLGGAAARDVTRVDAYAAKLILETWFGSP